MPALRPVRLFVYGSLRPDWPGELGVDDPAIARLKAVSTWLGRGAAPGRLWRISWYPGMTRGRPGERVVGDVLEFAEPGLLAALDAYEDASGGEGLYVRGRTRVALDDGRQVGAWVWRYGGSLEGARRIGDGDFLADLARAPQLAIRA
jgi:gamma-glutamylcyclotransferase (GGCT)/AIG2-like uncharacterized protein YtfP